MAREMVIRITAPPETATAQLGKVETALGGVTKQATVAHKAVGDEKSGLAGGLSMLGKAMLAVGAGRAVSQVVDYGGKLTDLAAKTGIGVEALQRLAFVGGQVGVSIDAVANGVLMLQRRLSTDKGAQQAIADLGLNVNMLLSMRPEEMFTAISTAISKIPDPAQRTTAAFEIMGRSSGELIPLMVSDVKGLGDSVLVMSDSATRGLDMMGDTWSRLKFIVGTVVGEAVGMIAVFVTKLQEWQDATGIGLANIYTFFLTSAINIVGAISRIVTAFAAMPGQVTSFVKQTYDGIKTWMVDKFNAIVDSIKAKVDMVTGFFKDMYIKVVGGSYVPDMIEEIGDQFRQLGRVMVTPAANATNTVGGFFKSLGSTVSNTLQGMVRGMVSAFGSMLSGAMSWKEGLASIWNSIQQSFMNMLTNMLNAYLNQFLSRLTGAGGAMGGMFGGGGGSGAGGAGGAGGMFGGMAGQLIGGGGMAAGGIGMMVGARTTSQHVIGGTMTGAGIGTMIMPGIGTAIGAGIGALVGFVRSRTANNTAKDREDFAKQLGFASLGELYDHLRGFGPDGDALAHVGLNVIGRRDTAGNEAWMGNVVSFLQQRQMAAQEAAFAGMGGSAGGYQIQPVDMGVSGMPIGSGAPPPPIRIDNYITVELDGRTIAEVVVPYIPAEVDRLGLGTA